MTPLGLHHIMGAGHHYGPAPWVKVEFTPKSIFCYTEFLRGLTENLRALKFNNSVYLSASSVHLCVIPLSGVTSTLKTNPKSSTTPILLFSFLRAS